MRKVSMFYNVFVYATYLFSKTLLFALIYMDS